MDQTSCKLHADFAATSYELRELRKFICICMLTSVNLWRTKLSNLNPTLYGLRTSPSQTTFELTLLCACVNSRNFAPEVRYCIQDYFEKRRNIIQYVSSAYSPEERCSSGKRYKLLRMYAVYKVATSTVNCNFVSLQLLTCSCITNFLRKD